MSSFATPAEIIDEMVMAKTTGLQYAVDGLKVIVSELQRENADLQLRLERRSKLDAALEAALEAWVKAYKTGGVRAKEWNDLDSDLVEAYQALKEKSQS